MLCGVSAIHAEEQGERVLLVLLNSVVILDERCADDPLQDVGMVSPFLLCWLWKSSLFPLKN